MSTLLEINNLKKYFPDSGWFAQPAHRRFPRG